MAVTASQLWLDGTIVATTDATAPLMGHAAQRGSLVFDVGSFHKTPKGPALFRAREHVVRFLRSMKIVGLESRFDEDALVRAASEVVAASGHEEGLVRWSAFFAAREPDLVPENGTTRVAVAAQAVGETARREPIKVAVFDDARKASPEVLPPQAKVAAAYLGPMLARRRALATGADEVVLLDQDGGIAEAPTANAFAVVSGVLRTPPLTRVLAGITRDSVIAIARAEGIEVREESVPLDVFAGADEAFLASTSMPISPIGRVNDRVIKQAPGPITMRLLERILGAQHGADAARQSWLTFVR